MGSSGTGKTLALVNALKTKVAFYKKQKKNINIMLCAGVTNLSQEWVKDMKSEKYGLKTIIQKYQCEPMRFKDVRFKGRVKYLYLVLASPPTPLTLEIF